MIPLMISSTTRPKPSRHRSRRLQKKLCIGEFQAMGFHLDFWLHPQTLTLRSSEIFDQFIDKLEDRKLECGGGGSNHKMHFFVMADRQKSASEDDRAYVLWMVNQFPEIIQVNASALVDAQYEI